MDRIGILIDLLGKDAAVKSLQQLLELKKEISKDKAQVHIDLRKAEAEIQSLKAKLVQLEREKIRIQADTSGLKEVESQISSVKKHISDLKAENRGIRIAIELLKTNDAAQAVSLLNDQLKEFTVLRSRISNNETLLPGLDKAGSLAEVTRQINDINAAINAFNKGKNFGITEMRNQIAQNKAEIEAYSKTLDSLNGKKLTILEDTEKNVAAVNEEITKTKQLLQDTESAASKLRLAEGMDKDIIKAATDQIKEHTDAQKQATKEFEEAEKEKARVAEEAERAIVEAEQRAAEEAQAHAQAIADAIDTVSNALETLSSYAGTWSDVFGDIASIGSGFGDMLGNIASMFSGGNILETVGETLLQNATNAVTSRLGNIVERYDIMKTFVPYMELAGVSQKDAEDALKRINTSILGLPIGLSDAAQRFRKYQMYVEDVERATNLTIGAQWAITAGGAADRYKTQAYNQIDYLLTAGELNSIRQWRSLMNGLGVSTRFLKEEMGYAAMSNAEFTAALSEGEITVDEFLHGLEALANSTGGIKEALNIYKSTLESWGESIGFAITRGGESVLKGINELSKNIFGEELTDLAETFRDKIDEVFASVDQYIEGHPEIFKSLADSLEGLFGVFGKFDLESIATKTLNNLGDVIDAIADAIDRLDPKAVEDFIAFGTTWAGPLSEAIATISSGLPGLMAVFDRLREFDWASFTSTVLDHVETAFNTLANILDILPDSVINNFLAFAIVDAPIIEKFLGGISRIIGMLAKIIIPPLAIVKLGGIKNVIGKIGGLFAGESLTSIISVKGFFTAIGGVAAAIGIIGEIALVIRAWTWALQSISDLDIDEGFAKKALVVAGAFEAAGAIVGGLTTAFAAIFSLTGGAGGAGGIAALVGEGLTAGIGVLMLLVAEAVATFADAAKSIGDINLEGYGEKVTASLQAIKDITGALAGEVFESDQAALAAANVDEAVTHYANIKESLEKLKDIDKIDIDFDAVTNMLTGAYGLVKDVKVGFGTDTEIQDMVRNSEVYDTMFTYLASAMESLSSVATSLNTMKTQFDEFGIDMSDVSEGSKWTQFKDSIGQIAQEVMNVFNIINQRTGGDAKKALKNAREFPEIISKMKEVFVGLEPVMTAFQGLGWQMNQLGMDVNDQSKLKRNSDWFTFKNRLTNAVRFIGDIYALLEEKFPEVTFPSGAKTDNTTFGANSVENINNIVQGFSGMFENLKTSMEKLFNLGQYLDEFDGKYMLGKGRQTLDEQLADIETNIKDSLTHVKSIMNAIGGSTTWKGYTNEKYSKSAKSTSFNFMWMMDYLKGTFENLKLLGDTLSGYTSIEAGSLASKVDSMMTPIGNIIKAIEKLELTTDEEGGEGTNITQTGKKAQGLSQAIGFVMTALKSIADKAKMIQGVTDEDLGTKVSDAVKNLMTGFDELPKNMDEVKTRAENFQTAFDSVIEVALSLKENLDTINEVANNGSAMNLSQIMYDMLTGLQGDWDLGSLATVASNLNGAFQELAQTVETLSTADIGPFVEDLGNLGDAVNEVKDKLLELQTQLTHTREHVLNLRSSIESLAKMMDNKQGNLDSFKSHLDYVRNAASNAATQVNRLRNAIDALHDKEITIKTTFLQTGGSVPTQNFAHYRWRHADGGMIYAASGFHKRGTDVVPAMLTPGEFVMRRAAVQKFGAGFMARLNQLNLDGALQMLYSARKLPQSVSNVINNARSYDNHATVNQYITSPSQNYSHRRAYRYLRTV